MSFNFNDDDSSGSDSSNLIARMRNLQTSPADFFNPQAQFLSLRAGFIDCHNNTYYPDSGRGKLQVEVQKNKIVLQFLVRPTNEVKWTMIVDPFQLFAQYYEPPQHPRVLVLRPLQPSQISILQAQVDEKHRKDEEAKLAEKNAALAKQQLEQQLKLDAMEKEAQSQQGQFHKDETTSSQPNPTASTSLPSSSDALSPTNQGPSEDGKTISGATTTNPRGKVEAPVFVPAPSIHSQRHQTQQLLMTNPFGTLRSTWNRPGASTAAKPVTSSSNPPYSSHIPPRHPFSSTNQSVAPVHTHQQQHPTLLPSLFPSLNPGGISTHPHYHRSSLTFLPNIIITSQDTIIEPIIKHFWFQEEDPTKDLDLVTQLNQYLRPGLERPNSPPPSPPVSSMRLHSNALLGNDRRINPTHNTTLTEEQRELLDQPVCLDPQIDVSLLDLDEIITNAKFGVSSVAEANQIGHIKQSNSNTILPTTKASQTSTTLETATPLKDPTKRSRNFHGDLGAGAADRPKMTKLRQNDGLAHLIPKTDPATLQIPSTVASVDKESGAEKEKEEEEELGDLGLFGVKSGTAKSTAKSNNGEGAADDDFVSLTTGNSAIDPSLIENEIKMGLGQSVGQTQSYKDQKDQKQQDQTKGTGQEDPKWSSAIATKRSRDPRGQ